MKRNFLIIILTFTSRLALALTAPEGALAPNLPAPATDSLKAAAAEAFQYGPGVWVAPGPNAMVAGAKIVNNIGLAPFLGFLSNSSEVDFPADYSLSAGVFAPNFPMPLNKLPTTTIYSPPTPVPIGNAILDVGKIIQFGFFNSSTFTDSDPMIIRDWATAPPPVHGYLGTYIKLTDLGMVISKQSRGWLFVNSTNEIIQDPAIPALADKSKHLRQVFSRHNQLVASYRAIGLNPMWALKNLTSIGAEFPNYPEQVSDYLLTSYAKYFYREGQKHLADINQEPNALNLLYKVSAAALAYEAATTNIRYAPADPSCRYEKNNLGLCPGISDPDPEGIYTGWTAIKPHQASFGVASEYVIVYDMLKFLFGSKAEAAAAAIANTADITALKAAVNAKLGVPYPNALATAGIAQTADMARALFNKALAEWSAQPSVEAKSQLLVPRASAAFIVAAAITGKRLDPVFWGTLAEAEQAIFKGKSLAEYTAWVGSLWNDVAIKNDYGLSSSDLAYFRNITGNKLAYINSHSFDGDNLQKFLQSVRDPFTGEFALARGPNGLVGLNNDRYEISARYIDKVSSEITATPFPNAYLEVAESGRAVIDGRLLFDTDGGVQAYDFDNSLLAINYLLPFEKAVVNSYQRSAAFKVWGIGVAAVPAAVKALSLQARSQVKSAAAKLAEQKYKEITGNFKPLNSNLTDSRVFVPPLEFWLVTSQKLNANGFDAVGVYNPPQLGAVVYAPKVRKNYVLKNLQSVTLVDSLTRVNPVVLAADDPKPLSNTFPLDGYTKGSDWTNWVGNVFERTVRYPFLTGTNGYLKPGVIPQPAPCVLLTEFNGKRDPNVQCP